MTNKGFLYNGCGRRHRIYYIDSKGKDAGIERWRLSLYYEPNYALTLFFPDEASYNHYIQEHQPVLYDDYSDFENDWHQKGGINEI